MPNLGSARLNYDQNDRELRWRCGVDCPTSRTRPMTLTPESQHTTPASCEPNGTSSDTMDGNTAQIRESGGRRLTGMSGGRRFPPDEQAAETSGSWGQGSVKVP
jgi:hypothetical protein